MDANFDEEPVAAELVAGELGGTPTQREVPGAPPKTHDFDIDLSDGRVVALVVTSSADFGLKSMWAAIHTGLWDARALRTSWTLQGRSMPPGTRCPPPGYAVTHVVLLAFGVLIGTLIGAGAA